MIRDEHLPTEVVPGDGVFEEIVRIAARDDTLNVLEIGCSDGQGSTFAVMKGFDLRRREAPKAHLYAIDLSPLRSAACRERYKKRDDITVLCGMSCSPADVAGEDEIRAFKGIYPASLLLQWRAGLFEYVSERDPKQHMILSAKLLARQDFDLAIIDGCEFSARAELDRVYGSRWIVLDDTQVFKNASNYARLLKDPLYTLVSCDPGRRNGWAVFGRKGQI